VLVVRAGGDRGRRGGQAGGQAPATEKGEARVGEAMGDPVRRREQPRQQGGEREAGGRTAGSHNAVSIDARARGPAAMPLAAPHLRLHLNVAVQILADAGIAKGAAELMRVKDWRNDTRKRWTERNGLD
jgi:hypothetical protein